MKGIIFTEFLEMVEKRFGTDRVDHIVNTANLSNGGAYTSVGDYDPEELIRLVAALSENTGTPYSYLLSSFGEGLFSRLATLYPYAFQSAQKTFDFLRNVNNLIKTEIEKLYPDGDVPLIDVAQSDPECAVVVYRSNPSLTDLVEGLLIGCADHFGEIMELERDMLEPESGQETRFTLTSHGPSANREEALHDRLNRERLARKMAETLLEEKSLDLYRSKVALEEKLEVQIRESEGWINQFKQEILDRQYDFEALEQRHQELTRIHAELQERYQQLGQAKEELTGRHNKLIEQKQVLEDRLTDQISQLKSTHEDVQRQLRERHDAYEALERRHQELARIQEELQDHHQQLVQSNEELARLHEEVIREKQALEQRLTEQIGQVESANETLLEELKQQKEVLEALEASSLQLTLANDELGWRNRELTQAKEALEQERLNLVESRDRLESEMTAEVTSLRETTTALHQEISGYQERYGVLERRHEQSTQENLNLGQQIQGLLKEKSETQRNLDEVSQARQETEQRYLELGQAMNSLELEYHKVQRAKEELEGEMKGEISSLQSKTDHLSGLILEHEHARAVVEQRYHELFMAKEELEEKTTDRIARLEVDNRQLRNQLVEKEQSRISVEDRLQEVIGAKKELEERLLAQIGELEKANEQLAKEAACQLEVQSGSARQVQELMDIRSELELKIKELIQSKEELELHSLELGTALEAANDRLSGEKETRENLEAVFEELQQRIGLPLGHTVSESNDPTSSVTVLERTIAERDHVSEDEIEHLRRTLETEEKARLALEEQNRRLVCEIEALSKRNGQGALSKDDPGQVTDQAEQWEAVAEQLRPEASMRDQAILESERLVQAVTQEKEQLEAQLEDRISSLQEANEILHQRVRELERAVMERDQQVEEMVQSDLIVSQSLEPDDSNLAERLVDPALGRKLPLHILVAEDNAVSQMVAKRALNQLGYSPTLVSSGREVFEALETDPFDVVLTDLIMPEIDGLEVSRLMSQRYTRDQRPWVIGMLSNPQPGERDECLAAGMNDCISKPIRAVELQSALMRYRTPSQDEPTLTDLDTLEVIDWSKWRRPSDSPGGPNILGELIELFLKDTARQLGLVEKAVTQDDLVEMGHAARRLKGSATNLGARRMVVLCDALEKSVMDRSSNNMNEVVRTLRAEFKHACDELEQLTSTTDTAPSQSSTSPEDIHVH